MEAKLNEVLGLHRTTSTVPIDSITSFAESIKTEKAFKQFCRNLYECGVTAKLLSQNESEFLNILNSPNTASNIHRDQSQLLPVSYFSRIIFVRNLLIEIS